MPRVTSRLAPSCAIDFGTSNSAVARVVDASGLSKIELAPLEQGVTSMPTAVFYSAEDGSRSFGRVAENGFTAEDMLRMRIGPVIMTDEIEYFREVKLLQEIRVSFACAGLAPDGSRFTIRNEFAHADGTRCAVVTSTGGWLDLNQRKLVAPPEALKQAMESLFKVEGFRELRSSVAR